MPLVELDVEMVDETARRLEDRIAERFPDSGLRERAEDLIELIDRLRRRSDEIAQPIRWIRILYVVLGIIVVAGFVAVPIEFEGSLTFSPFGFAQFVETVVNDLVLLGAGLLFLSTLETRIKRRRALKELHEIRSFAHVIDMMQLTKDPSRLARFGAQPTESSPEATLSPYELGRYLDYCSEMLSLSAKGAAMLAQRFDDAAVLATVNEIEDLTSGLSRKIWQKLMILMTTDPDAAPTAADDRAKPDPAP